MTDSRHQIDLRLLSSTVILWSLCTLTQSKDQRDLRSYVKRIRQLLFQPSLVPLRVGISTLIALTDHCRMDITICGDTRFAVNAP